ncbi:hypothetical protein ACFQZF_11250 [Flavobacterium myungsuense]|uniref:Uncharacterized protein n=1 Tax=Flavobacterium myungsuense TaxID=651823 RepID=A0ABW3J0A8_9FLAO
MLDNPTKTRLCPFSNTFFEAKRQNQIYRSKFDRISANNERNNSLRRKLNSVNKELLKSYKVADDLLGDKIEVIVNKHFMRGRGFSFQMFTNVVNQDDEIVYGLYDITFKKINDDEYLIRRKK